MTNIRIIPRLDIKGPNLIKGINLEGLRKIGDPCEYAKRYYEDGADELLYMDIVASLYGRNGIRDIVEHTAKDIFIPLTVGGGIRSVDDVRDMLHSGADKVAINTAAIANPSLISDIANKFGAQCMVISIEAKRQEDGTWEVYTDNGRERTGKKVLDWVKEVQEHGAGEVLLTSVDKEGMAKGYDVELIKEVDRVCKVPLIVSGGCGELGHFNEVVLEAPRVNAVSFAHILHYGHHKVSDIKKYAKEHGIEVRYE